MAPARVVPTLNPVKDTRRPERFVAVVGKAGRRLCRDVALHLDLVVLARNSISSCRSSALNGSISEADATAEIGCALRIQFKMLVM